MPETDLAAPWVATSSNVKVYGDIKSSHQRQSSNTSIDLYSRPIHRQPSEKLQQQRYRCMNSLPSDSKLNAPTNTIRGNKPKPRIHIKQVNKVPERGMGIACPSPVSPQFRVNFLQNDPSQSIVDTHLSLDGATQMKALLDTGKDGRSVLGRNFPKSIDPNYIYPLPSDDAELSRLDKEHELVKELFNCIYRSPIEKLLDKGIKVLDVGCGSGSWCIEMASKYKRSHFTGIDICLKRDGPAAPNLTMLKVDMSEPFPFARETFDFVFCRNLSLAIPFDDWDRTIEELTRVAKYNAYLEFIEADWELKRTNIAMKKWNTFAIAALRNRQYNPRIGRNLDVFLRFHLSEVNNTYLSMPVGEWSGTKIGIKAQSYWTDTIASLKPIILGSTDPKVIGFASYERLAKLALKELASSQTYCNYYAYYGRKAEEIPIYLEKRQSSRRNRSLTSNKTLSGSSTSSPPSDCSDTTDTSGTL
ncbi:hypothetical protein INT43_004015 [Umbelopsis isabellina]|uniref:Methyltransferase domain-containing protein n=1 Tax=Mortierella isabellina TaxID=91625 RepID=A0A8H7PW07_MORIS|nr:hypothetical protein INT43_004015 [Umbelopsis isabellina]